jgi:ABC-type antimicrobial peptide transport system permease subunit
MKKKFYHLKTKIGKTLVTFKKEVIDLIFKSKKGELSWYLIFKIAFKNLLAGRTRSLITVGAIAVGTAVVVVLISFAYGLQKIVTKRLIQPNSLRLTDVQTSSTAVSLTQERLKEIEKIPGVEKIAAAVSLAGSLEYNDLKMDTIVLGANNLFLDFAHTNLITGRLFSKKSEAKYQGKTDLEDLLAKMEEGEVAGIFEDKEPVAIGQEINGQKIAFRLSEETYYPLRESPTMTAKILGYVQGSFLKNETGVEVWGGTYESVSTVGKFYQDKNGQWYGKWIKTKMPIFDEVATGLYLPKADGNGSQIKEIGYLAEKDVKILSQEELVIEKQIEGLLKKYASGEAVLGEATGEADLTAVTLDKNATQTAELKQIIEKEKQKNQATAEAQLAIVEVKKKEGKEVLVSTSLLRTLKIKPEKILGQKINLSYIISGNLMPKVSGRVLSKPVSYQIVGVVKDDKNLLVISPLADLESMGVSRYSTAKVLVKNEDQLALVRQKIESLGFVTLSIVDTLNQVNRLFRLLRFLLGAFGAIALVVAILGMFNTLTVSLLERTREIAVMKTLGTTDRDVGRLFLAESVIIGFFGGILGIFLGQQIGGLINFISSFFRDDKSVSLFVSPFYFLVMILLLSIGIGIVTGIYPSKRAKNISPLDALRYE